MYIVLKPFKFSHNGIDIVHLKKGDKFEYETSSIDNLVQEGFLKPVEKIENKIIESLETKPLHIKKDKGG